MVIALSCQPDRPKRIFAPKIYYRFHQFSRDAASAPVFVDRQLVDKKMRCLVRVKDACRADETDGLIARHGEPEKFAITGKESTRLFGYRRKIKQPLRTQHKRFIASI